MIKAFRKTREYVSLGSVVIFFLTLVSLVLFIIVNCSTSFADFFNYYMTAPFRAFITTMTSWIPFSLAEMAIISIPLWATVLIVYAIKESKKGTKSAVKYLCGIISALCVIFMTFVWTYSSGYHTTTIDKKLEIDREKISATELYETANWLTDNINALAPKILYGEDGASIMNYSYKEMSSKICDAYDTFTAEYPILVNFDSKIKPIVLSEPFTYTHISGVYSFMTGESNVNVNYPDFIVASTSAHELAHQRGIAREDEANFVAFMVCISSDDPYLQYSGYLDVYSEVMNALYSADKELYSAVASRLCTEAKRERISYSKFFEKYAHSKTSEISNSINNSFLQANGQEQGTKSYGMVTDLTVAYYKAKIKS